LLIRQLDTEETTVAKAVLRMPDLQILSLARRQLRHIQECRGGVPIYYLLFTLFRAVAALIETCKQIWFSLSCRIALARFGDENFRLMSNILMYA